MVRGIILLIKNITTCQQQCCVTITLRSHFHVLVQLMKYLKWECMFPSNQWILSNSGTKPGVTEIKSRLIFFNILCLKQKKWVLLFHCNLLFVGQLWAKNTGPRLNIFPWFVFLSLSSTNSPGNLTAMPWLLSTVQSQENSSAPCSSPTFHDLCCCSFSRKGSQL